MAEAHSQEEPSHYNTTAIRVAEQLHEARVQNLRNLQKAQEAAGQAVGPEQLFPAFNRAGLGVALEYERMGHQPVSAGLTARSVELGVRFEHLGLTLGSVLHGVDLKGELTEELVAFIRDALLERKVIFFRDQHLSEDEQVAFGRRFGELDAFPFAKSGDNPYIVEISHDENHPGTENGWHTDVTWMEQPSLGSIAQCVQTPPIGGDTLFSDSHACLLGMPAGLFEQIEHLHGINDYRIFLTTRSPGGLPEELVSSIKAQIPFGVAHPLVRTHPETGKAGLYIHGGFLRHDSLYDSRSGETLDPGESKALVRELLTQHSRPEYQCRFHWEPGSVAFWDNRAVQHYATSDYFPHPRLLRRVTVSGDKPFYDPSIPLRTAD